MKTKKLIKIIILIIIFSTFFIWAIVGYSMQKEKAVNKVLSGNTNKRDTNRTKNTENIIELADENNQITKFEIVTILEVDGNSYYILNPIDVYEEDSLVLKYVKDEKGEENLTTIEDDNEFNRVSDAYKKWLESEDNN